MVGFQKFAFRLERVRKADLDGHETQLKRWKLNFVAPKLGFRGHEVQFRHFRLDLVAIKVTCARFA